MKSKKMTFRGKVTQGISDMFLVWRRELRKVFHDQGVLIFFILVPLAYPLIYAFIYNNEVVREVPAVVVDDSGSALSRQFARMVDGTADVRIVARCADMEEARQVLREGEAYGIFYFPDDFTDRINRGEQSQVSIFCDMSGLLYYKAMLLSATEVSLELNADIKVARAGNTTAEQDAVTAMPIEYEEVALFNPQNGFATFLIPAVLMLVIQHTVHTPELRQAQLVTQLVIGAYQFVLHLEIHVIARAAVSLHGNYMLVRHHTVAQQRDVLVMLLRQIRTVVLVLDELFRLVAQLSNLYKVAPDHQVARRIDPHLQDIPLLHINLSILLLVLGRRRQTPRQSLVGVH